MGYQTPKIDTRAAIFKDGKILLVHEANGTWTFPGGWVDVNVSVMENTIKEIKEEVGLDIRSYNQNKFFILSKSHIIFNKLILMKF